MIVPKSPSAVLDSSMVTVATTRRGGRYMHARVRHNAVWTLGLGLALLLLSGPTALAEQPSTHTSPLEPGQGADLAVRTPDEYAWRLFADISQSAGNGSNDTVWETWADQSQLYTNDPSHTPVWPDSSHRPKELGPSLQHVLAGLPAGGPGQPNGDDSPPGQDDVHIDRATFDYVVANQIWSMQGLTTFVQHTKVKFPVDSVAVKARWLVIKPSDEPRYHWQTYHNPNTNKDEIVGLVALHIASKVLPNWAWATFEHVDNPGRCDFMGCHDLFGQIPADVAPHNKEGQQYPPEILTPALHDLFSAAGLGPEWQNYRLKGAQVDFTTTTGQPILLGNSVTEAGFVATSSCMTCHARATVDTQGGGLPIFLPSPPLTGAVGTPDPSWFPVDDQGTSLYYQTDFLWELPLITTIADQSKSPESN